MTMQSLDAPTADNRVPVLPSVKSTRDYNFEHFTAKVLFEDIQRTVKSTGLRPGELAPDFTLPRADGGEVQLSTLRGKPVVLHFGSLT